jgi:hypothetical protein
MYNHNFEKPEMTWKQFLARHEKGITTLYTIFCWIAYAWLIKWLLDR